MESLIGDNAEKKQKLGYFTACLIALISFFRLLPLFFYRRPGTPLRVLCLMAFETVHVLRTSRRISSQKLQTLSLLLDFGANANDYFDKNDFSYQEYLTTRRQLEQTLKVVKINEYVGQLRQLENQRPQFGGDDQQHRKVQTYRESVIRLSLGMIASTALEGLNLEEGIRATYNDDDLKALFRIVMLCQIFDDIFDFTQDSRDGVPSFLTGHATLSQALAMTSKAAMQYADYRNLSSAPHLFPFHLSLLGVSIIACPTVWICSGIASMKHPTTTSVEEGLEKRPEAVQHQTQKL